MSKTCPDELKKTLLIKEKAFSRLEKECQYYQNEINNIQEKIIVMEKENPNNYEIITLNKLLDESIIILQDVYKKKDKMEEEIILLKKIL